METPKPKGGRPRRRPFAAHDARRVAIRLRHAAEAMQALRWSLQDSDEVGLYLYEKRRADVMWLKEQIEPVERAIRRLATTLAYKSVPKVGQPDA